MRAICLLVLLGMSGSVMAQAPKGAGTAGADVQKDVAYGSHARQKLDIAVPKSDKPLPLVIWIHGGGWEAGDKAGNPAVILLSHGYAIASINYRYSSQAVFPAQILDCKAAVRFLRDNAKKYNIDPDHIAVWGASAGGHLSLLMGTTAGVEELDGTEKTSSRVQAVVDWFGPTDLIKLSPSFVTSNPITKLIGGTTGEKAKVATLANPITHLTKDDAPVLIFHGDKDQLVPLSQSELFDAAMKKLSLECEMIVFKNADHGGKEFQTQVSSEANKKKLIDFLDKHLKK